MKSHIGVSPPEMFYQLLLKHICGVYYSVNKLCLGQIVIIEDDEDVIDEIEKLSGESKISSEDIYIIYNSWIGHILRDQLAIFPDVTDDVRNYTLSFDRGGFGVDEKNKIPKPIEKVQSRSCR